MTYRAAKLHAVEHILDPLLVQRVLVVLDRFSGRKRDIRPAFLARIIALASEQK
jgi:hypothetical protein